MPSTLRSPTPRANRYAPAPRFHFNDEPLLFFGGAGHEFRDSTYQYNALERRDPSHIVLQITLSGTGYHQRHGSPAVPLPPGSLFVDRIPGPFNYGHHQGVYEHVFLALRGRPAEDLFAQFHSLSPPVVHLGPRNSITPLILSLIHAPSDALLSDRYLFSGYLYSLMMQLLSAGCSSRTARSPLVNRALDLIQTHASDARFNVTTLAHLLDCSREHLSREFRSALGLSPVNQLTRGRIRLATQLLRGEPLKLHEVAKRSGFTSEAYFCRVFKLTVGTTPGHFRKHPSLLLP